MRTPFAISSVFIILLVAMSHLDKVQFSTLGKCINENANQLLLKLYLIFIINKLWGKVKSFFYTDTL